METVKSAINTASEAITGQPTAPPREPDDWLKASEVETIKPDEDDKIDQIGETIKRMIDHNFDAHQHKYRATHVKSLAFVKGTLTIKSDLPTHLQYGIAAQPGKTYPVIARYANEPSFILPDNQRAPRGLSMKVFGVQGQRLEDDGRNTQDFLYNNAPMIELTDIDTTLEIFKLREENFDSPAKLQLELAKRSDRLKQFAPSMLPNTYVVGDEMFTQSAFAYGPYVAHYSLAPTSTAQTTLSGENIPSDAGPTFHRDHLRTYYRENSGSYTFRVQFASDKTAHPVEDASVVWPETTSPWHDIATITFPSQETFSDERRTWWEEKNALSPWDGLVDHKPLGGINRLRKRVYEKGRGHRAAGNQVKVDFPDSPDDMPA